MNVDVGEIASVASGLGGAGLGGRVLLHWLAGAQKEKAKESRERMASALKFNNDASKMFFAGIEHMGGAVLVAFAAAALFVMLSPIVLPLFANVSITVFLPRSFNLWVFEFEKLKTIHTGIRPGTLGPDGNPLTVKEILLLPIHFAFCINIFGFWVADRGLKS